MSHAESKEPINPKIPDPAIAVAVRVRHPRFTRNKRDIQKKQKQQNRDKHARKFGVPSFCYIQPIAGQFGFDVDGRTTNNMQERFRCTIVFIYPGDGWAIRIQDARKGSVYHRLTIPWRSLGS